MKIVHINVAKYDILPHFGIGGGRRSPTALVCYDNSVWNYTCL